MSDFAIETPDMTTDAIVPGICGETLAVCAYPGRVIIEAAEGPDLVAVHLDLAMARAHVLNIEAAIVAASLLASGEAVTVRPGEVL